MTWIALLLADPSPCLRWRVLREILHRPDDDEELSELHALRLHDTLVAPLLSWQDDDGAWRRGDPAWRGTHDPIRHTSVALWRLGSLGFGPELSAVQRAGAFLWRSQGDDGSWPLNDLIEESDAAASDQSIAFQTALPLAALGACGHLGTDRGSHDPRVGRAFQRLMAQRLDDGAWPTGRGVALAASVRNAQGPYGLWEYLPDARATRWLTLDLILTMQQLATDPQWFGLEPPESFQAYPKRRYRF